jgi:hypothetical protein
MKSGWCYLMMLGGLILATALVAGCEEEQEEGELMTAREAYALAVQWSRQGRSDGYLTRVQAGCFGACSWGEQQAIASEDGRSLEWSFVFCAQDEEGRIYMARTDVKEGGLWASSDWQWVPGGAAACEDPSMAFERWVDSTDASVVADGHGGSEFKEKSEGNALCEISGRESSLWLFRYCPVGASGAGIDAYVDAETGALARVEPTEWEVCPAGFCPLAPLKIVE